MTETGENQTETDESRTETGETRTGTVAAASRRAALRLVGGGFAAALSVGATGSASGPRAAWSGPIADPEYELRVVTFRTPRTRFGTGEEERALRAYVDQYNRRYGGLALSFEESGETYPRYDRSRSSGENRRRFRRWLSESSAAAEEGCVHLLMVSDVTCVLNGRVVSSADAGGYAPDGRTTVVCNVANKLRGGVTAWEATVMHEVGHALGCRHADGAQYVDRRGRANSPMLLYYGSVTQDPPSDRCSHARNAAAVVENTERLSLRLTPCTLSATRDHLRRHF
ncbi:hypothetical protein [Halegenticoccus soli]|uniref:hypothetical protein n=1 Tax=Halegenticoccus soli TaxID=1985678 RepID=UPI000C6E29AD|nr:hypothetical protein [Halegenticoccus soli]